jgi:polyhydroxyalkanoate synthesis regulator phasin
MDAPGSGTTPPERDPLERIATLLALRLDELRSVLDDAGTRWRGDALRVGEGTRRRINELAREAGLVTREDWDELELRVAQVEHRLRLLEDVADRPDRDRP